MNSYELMLIFDANLGEEKIGEIINKIEGKIKGFGGEIEKTDKWGNKRLSARFRKAKNTTQAFYVMIYLKSPSSLPGEIRGYLKVTENLLRYAIYLAVPPVLREITGVAAPGEAVSVGEIKEAGEKLGES